ncbi:hypothetical protein Xcab_01409 [Xenorhabdus cabanillasii JM26]|nr:hypothetical protein Xcab_01409 [Xenorhabdus cabanillasii JM26]
MKIVIYIKTIIDYIEGYFIFQKYCLSECLCYLDGIISFAII